MFRATLVAAMFLGASFMAGPAPAAVEKPLRLIQAEYVWQPWPAPGHWEWRGGGGAGNTAVTAIVGGCAGVSTISGTAHPGIATGRGYVSYAGGSATNARTTRNQLQSGSPGSSRYADPPFQAGCAFRGFSLTASRKWSRARSGFRAQRERDAIIFRPQPARLRSSAAVMFRVCRRPSNFCASEICSCLPAEILGRS